MSPDPRNRGRAVVDRLDDTAIDAMRWFLDNGEDINSRPPGGA